MSADAVRIDVPIIHTSVVVYLAVFSVGYALFVSNTVLGVPVIWLGLGLYVTYLLYRVVLAVERIAYES
ncbi:hypothetical protein [Halosolutus gelatinilyticus]|uniref:hypothetical protein n=1 Tax=Halosolutus gelatinilyticus TaxID=2931975 RepID=UPI001FF2BE92|nr:hypothetical protein [Halosolutus gelatinilyticus]